MTFVCCNGHTNDFQTTRNIRCPVCVKEKNLRYRVAHPDIDKTRRLNMSNEQRLKANQQNRVYKARLVVEGRRDYFSENVARSGKSFEEYVAWRQNRSDRAKERLRLKSIPKDLKHDAHVKMYRTTKAYHCRNYHSRYEDFKEKEKHRCLVAKSEARKRLDDWYVASCFGSSVAKLPAPLIALARQIIISRRFINELEQRGSSKRNVS